MRQFIKIHLQNPIIIKRADCANLNFEWKFKRYGGDTSKKITGGELWDLVMDNKDIQWGFVSPYYEGEKQYNKVTGEYEYKVMEWWLDAEQQGHLLQEPVNQNVAVLADVGGGAPEELHNIQPDKSDIVYKLMDSMLMYYSETEIQKDTTNIFYKIYKYIEKNKELKKILRQEKKFGLVWENQIETVVEQCKKEMPILESVPELSIQTSKDDIDHIMIEGDNYHALSILNYTHKGKIDVIYIDPPYNTGNKDFTYNDKYVDKDDGYRHSKWISFMEKRLELAKELLSDKGVIFISIDDNEQASLKLLCDDVLGGENFVANLVWTKKDKTSGVPPVNRSLPNKEYILVYQKNEFRF